MNRGKHKLSIDVSHAIITIIVFVLFQETYFGPQPPVSVLKRPLINYVKGGGGGGGGGMSSFTPTKRGTTSYLAMLKGGGGAQ